MEVATRIVTASTKRGASEARKTRRRVVNRRRRDGRGRRGRGRMTPAEREEAELTGLR